MNGKNLGNREQQQRDHDLAALEADLRSGKHGDQSSLLQLLPIIREINRK